jgi:tetratricopeptide (TPR) repeat protein
MRHHGTERQTYISKLIRECEVLSQKGTVAFHEETVYIEMIDLLEQQGKWQQANKIADVAIAQHPFSTDLYIRKSELLLNHNMISECLVTIDRAEMFIRLNVPLKLLKADILSAMGEHDVALLILSELESEAESEDLSEVYLIEAGIREDLHQYPEMMRALRRCLIANPKNTEGYEKILFFVERKGYNREAIEVYNKLIDLDAYNWRAWRNLGFALRGIHRIDEAIEAFEYAFAIEEKCKIAYMEAAELLFDKGEYMHAVHTYENAIFNTKEDAETMLRMGHCYESMKEYKTATLFYQRALEFDDEVAEVYYRIGECARIQGQLRQAIDAFKTAIRLEYQREEFHAGLADAYFHNDQLADALFSYRKAAYIAPDDVTYWMRYAYFLINIGQEKMALRALDKADEYCGGPEIEYCRIACLYSMGKKEEALYRLGEALRCDYETHKTIFQWRPELAKNPDMQAVIMSFLP